MARRKIWKKSSIIRLTYSVIRSARCSYLENLPFVSRNQWLHLRFVVCYPFTSKHWFHLSSISMRSKNELWSRGEVHEDEWRLSLLEAYRPSASNSFHQRNTQNNEGHTRDASLTPQKRSWSARELIIQRYWGSWSGMMVQRNWSSKSGRIQRNWGSEFDNSGGRGL